MALPVRPSFCILLLAILIQAGDFAFAVELSGALTHVDPTPAANTLVDTHDVTITAASNQELENATLIGADGAGSDSIFRVSVDQTLWQKWGFKYPVTYIFDILGGLAEPTVLRRDRLTDPWSPMQLRHATDFFNGLEAVRFDDGKAYVSAGFGARNTIYLQFQDADVTFHSVARHYDNRAAVYTLSNDNWGRRSSANPGVPCASMTDDSCDKYQAAVTAARHYNLHVSIAINSAMAGGQSMWDRMQQELDVADSAWEPVVHTRRHPCSSSAYSTYGYVEEILGCRDDILNKLSDIPYGQHVFEFILPCAYQDGTLEVTSAGEFLFLRDWDGGDHPSSTDYAPWNTTYNYYGIGGLQTASYDSVLQSRSPAGRYYAGDVAALNAAFDAVYNAGGIFYAMWHSDRYQNSVIHSLDPPSEGVSGSTLMQHWEHVANRTDVWYVANGWLYSYKMVVDNVQVVDIGPGNDIPTMSDWSLASMILLVLTAGTVILRRSARAGVH